MAADVVVVDEVDDEEELVPVVVPPLVAAVAVGSRGASTIAVGLAPPVKLVVNS
jgi:hypothetical protein